MSKNVKYFYEFGEFRLDATRQRLTRNGEVIPLPPKAFDTLLVLAQNPRKLLEREALMQAVWADTFVEDANLTVAISNLRKALGQNGEQANYIETIPRVGYRFVADVSTVEDRTLPLVIEKHTVSQTVIEEDYDAEDEEALRVKTRELPATSATGLALNRRHIVAFGSVVLLAAVSVLIYLQLRNRPNLPASTSQVKSMAVLPFKTLDSRAEDQYLGLGLADALIMQLGSMREVSIRPLSAVRKYDGIEQDPLAVGRALNVDAVLEGTVQHHEDQLRVTMRLLRVGDGVLLWSGTFDEKFTDIFTIQDSISQSVAQASVLNLTPEDRVRLTKRYTANPQAYRLYLKGRYFWNKRTAAGLQKSLEYFEQAIASDPRFALAYAGLADAYALGVWQEALPQKGYIPKAKSTALRALEIDPNVGEAYASLGFVKFWYEWDFQGAESAFRRAIELSPNHATAHHWYGELLVLTGRPEEGLAQLRLAEEADPFSLIVQSDIGKMLFFTRRTDEAITQFKKTIEMDPTFPVAHLFLAMAYNQKGETDEAIATLEHEKSIPSSRAVFKFVRGFIYAQAGRRSEALRILQELQQPRPNRFVPAYGIALIHVGLGQTDQAFEWLERSRQDREPFLTYLKVDPNFESLRADPRFSDVLQRVGF
ncbi:MAG TPA: tetratricopeptide repeat protein [Pyrinomonadaceae bacterium]|nr:tetratricopeptide repeat protein [Pyrinomonadaceae bacterium]